ncbi:MAG: sigma 54-interacting transcriptional regulator, partial [Hydrogenophaga sp.]|nr:sigma 54-interacting transcriptional regulator [Hydrogenophaga sp.]
GTLFLDEVGELELATQAKLLKLLEDHEVRRLGSVRQQKVNVRVLAATNRPLEAMVQAGSFRSDLFFRLGALRVNLPPLREREGDVVLLAGLFLARSARRYGKPGLHLSDEALNRLRGHAWPGNVRELANVVEQCVMLASDDLIEADDLALPVPLDSAFAGLEPLNAEPAPTSLPEAERRCPKPSADCCSTRWSATAGTSPRPRARSASRATRCATASTSSGSDKARCRRAASQAAQSGRCLPSALTVEASTGPLRWMAASGA